MGDRYCINCGEKIINGAAYCHCCGSRVGKSVAVEKGINEKRAAGIRGQRNVNFSETVRSAWMNNGFLGEVRKAASAQGKHMPESRPVSKELINNKWRTRGLICSVIGLGALFFPFVKTSIFGVGFNFSFLLEMEESTIPVLIIFGILCNFIGFWKVYPMGGYAGGALMLAAAYMVNQEVAGSNFEENFLRMLLLPKASGFYALLISGAGCVFCAYRLSKAVKGQKN